MTDEEREVVQELVDALDNAYVHQWNLYEAAGFGAMIVDDHRGGRFSVTITARRLETPSEGKER